MKAIDKQWNAAGRPGSIEIKLSPVRFNVWCVVSIFLLYAVASALYVGLWGELTAYDWGHYIGAFFAPGNLLMLLPIVAAYLGLQGLMLWLLTGRDRSILHWQCDAVGIGLYADHPVRLSHYRWLLLTPVALLGFLPALYGLATGTTDCYVWGLWGIACALFDLNLLWRLRYYPKSDYYLATSRSYEGRIIVRGL